MVEELLTAWAVIAFMCLAIMGLVTVSVEPPGNPRIVLLCCLLWPLTGLAIALGLVLAVLIGIFDLIKQAIRGT